MKIEKVSGEAAQKSYPGSRPLSGWELLQAGTDPEAQGVIGGELRMCADGKIRQFVGGTSGGNAFGQGTSFGSGNTGTSNSFGPGNA